MRMKQLFLTIACLLSIVIGQAATKTYTWNNGSNTTEPFTPISGKTEQTCHATLAGVEWNFTFKNEGSDAFFFEATEADGFHLGSGSKWTRNLTVTTRGISGTIKSVKVTAKHGGGAAKLLVTVGDGVGRTSFLCNGSEYVSLDKTYGNADNGVYTFTGSASGPIEIKYSRSSGGANYLKAIEVVYETDDGDQGDGGETTVAAPVFSLPAGVYERGTEVTVSCSTPGAIMDVTSIEDPSIDKSGVKDPASYTFHVNKNMTVTAKAYITDQSGKTTYSNPITTSYTVTPPVGGTIKWEKTDIDELKSDDVVIIVDTHSSCALDPKSTGSACTATSVTLSGDADKKYIERNATENMWFQIVKTTDGYSFTHVSTSTIDTEKYLYYSGSGTATHVDATDKNHIFTWDSAHELLYNTGATRYLGVFTNSSGEKDWRCYLSTNLSNIKDTKTAFYKKVEEVFSLPSGEYEADTKNVVTVSCPATIATLTINGIEESEAKGQTSYSFPIDHDMDVKVTDNNGVEKTASYTLKKVEGAFVLTPLSEFIGGEQIVLVNQTSLRNMSSWPTTIRAKSNAVTGYDDKSQSISQLSNAEVFTVEKNVDGTISLRSNVLNGDAPLYLQYGGIASDNNTKNYINIAPLASTDGDLHKFDMKTEPVSGVENPVEVLYQGNYAIQYVSGNWEAQEIGDLNESRYASFYRLVKKAAMPTFSVTGGEVPYNTEVTVSTTEGAKLKVIVGDQPYLSEGSSYTFNVTAPVTVKATAYYVDANNNKIIGTESEAVVSYTLAKAAMPTFSVAGGEVPYNTEVTVSTTTEGAKLDVIVGKDTYTGKPSPFTFNVTADVDVMATAYYVDAEDKKVAVTESESTEVVSYTIAKAAKPTFTPAGGAVAAGTTVTVSTETEGAKLDVFIGDNEKALGVESPYTFKVTAGVYVIASAYKVGDDGAKINVTESDPVEATYTIKVPPISSNVFKLATSPIKPYTEYIIVADGKSDKVAMSSYDTSKHYYTEVAAEKNFTVYGDIIKLNSNAAVAKVVFEPVKDKLDEYYIRCSQGGKEGYIVTGTSSGKVGFTEEETEKLAASVRFEEIDGMVEIYFPESSESIYFRYNKAYPRFTCYKTKSVQDFYLYAAVETPAPMAKGDIKFREDAETMTYSATDYVVTGYNWSESDGKFHENTVVGVTTVVNDKCIYVYYDGVATAEQAAGSEEGTGVTKYGNDTYGAPEAAANYANEAQTAPVKLHVEVELLGNKDGEYSSYKMPNPEVPGGWDDQTYLKYYGVNQTRIYDVVDKPYVKVPITSKYSVVRATATGDGQAYTGTAESDVHAYYSPTGSTTGVEDVEASSDGDAEVKYYNLQGVRVSRPSNGVYIRVEGNRVSKVRVF